MTCFLRACKPLFQLPHGGPPPPYMPTMVNNPHPMYIAQAGTAPPPGAISHPQMMQSFPPVGPPQMVCHILLFGELQKNEESGGNMVFNVVC